MWIETEQDATERLYDAEIDVAVVFSANNTAQVEADVGAQFIDRYETITEHETA